MVRFRVLKVNGWVFHMDQYIGVDLENQHLDIGDLNDVRGSVEL